MSLGQRYYNQQILPLTQICDTPTTTKWLCTSGVSIWLVYRYPPSLLIIILLVPSSIISYHYPPKANTLNEAKQTLIYQNVYQSLTLGNNAKFILWFANKNYWSERSECVPKFAPLSATICGKFFFLVANIAKNPIRGCCRVPKLYKGS
jgi:hypothetical protein